MTSKSKLLLIEAALAKISEKQAKYTENDKQYWIAEQIKDIVRGSEANAELVYHDLDDDKMSLDAVEKQIAAYAKAHGGCTPPKPADDIIRKFFGLSELADKPKSQAHSDILDLGDFM